MSRSFNLNVENPSVFSVFENKGRQLHTTRSWNSLGLESESGKVSSLSAWNIGRYGEDTIIANLDTGKFTVYYTPFLLI